MLEALSRALFNKQVGCLDKRFVERRGWTVITARYPVLDVTFNHPSRAPLRLRFTCEDWDDLLATLKFRGHPPAYANRVGVELIVYGHPRGVFSNRVADRVAQLISTGLPVYLSTGQTNRAVNIVMLNDRIASDAGREGIYRAFADAVSCLFDAE